MRSIITNDLKHCYLCGTTENLELHHVEHGSKEIRRLATSYHLVVSLCSECHRGSDGVHSQKNAGKDLYLKKIGQKAWEENRVKKKKSDAEHVREEWVNVFGRDYLGDANTNERG